MEFNDKQAIYLQIADYVCEQIVLQHWPTEERIPSVRDLATLVAVNPNTVAKTYEFLQQKEIIFNKRGIGYFVDASATEKIKAYRRERFLETDLPEFFRNLYLLDIGMEEIEDRYYAFIRETYQNIKS